MRIKIKRIDKSLPLPAYQTPGALGIDLCAREDVVVAPLELRLIPLNVVVEVLDKRYATLLVPRSSLASTGLIQANSIGVIDHDYCGENDEIKICVYNLKDEAVTVYRGQRVAQLLFVRWEKCDIIEVSSVSDRSRGGFGSTG
ncbi:MAG: dUTP diphosphatase [Bacillota bacterium]